MPLPHRYFSEHFQFDYMFLLEYSVCCEVLNDPVLHDDMSRMLGCIYDGIHMPEMWDEAMWALRRRGGARFIFVGGLDIAANHIIDPRFYGPDDSRFLDGITEYDAFYKGSDPAAAIALISPNGRIADSRRFPESKRPAVEDYMRWSSDRFGSTHFHTRYTTPQDGLSFGIAFHPPASSGGLTLEQECLHQLVFEHMARAISIAAQPPDFLSPRQAWLLIDSRGRIRAASPAAETKLAQKDGLERDLNGCLACTHGQRGMQLHAVIRAALCALEDGGNGGEVAIPRPSGRRAWLVTVSPLPRPHAPWSALRPAALVRIVDPENLPEPPPERLRRLFGLTRREAELAAMLAAGDGSLRDTADDLGIAYATARVHLARIFEKTGVNSQTGLIRLFGRLS